MENRKQSNAGVDPIVLALFGVLVISTWCAWRVWIAAEAIKTAANDKNTYARVFVEHADGSRDLQSDNQALADEVNRSQLALIQAQGESEMLIGVCVFLALALAWRCWRLDRGQLSGLAKAGPGRLPGR